VSDPITTALQQIPDEPLSKDFDIPPFSKSIVKTPEAKIGGVPLDLSFEASATVDIDVFNAAGDKDPDGVFAATGDPAPQIPFEQQRAWLKYSFKGALKGDLGADFGMVGVAVKAGKSISLLDYRLHDATDNARVALAKDLVAPRSILSLSQVRDLKPGEALTMQIEGNLSAVVKFSWADAFSSAATELTKILSSTKPIAVKLSAGLTAAVGLDISDDFVFVVSRTATGQFRIAVKKAKSRGVDVAVAAKLGAEFESSQTVQTALQALVEGSIGQPLKTVDALLKKVTDAPSQLTAEEQEIFAALVERLHVKTAIDRVQAARDEIAKLQERLAAAIKAVATAKATIGFRYEYSRLTEESVLLDFILLQDGALDAAYELALRGDAATLAQNTIDQSATYKLLQYLNEKTVTRTQSLGFTLGLGKHAIAALDKSTIKTRTRLDVAGRKLIAFDGARSYTEKGVPQPDFTWVVDMKAEMAAYAEQPLTDQFDFGLHLQLDFPSIRQKDAEKMADFAAMWRAISDDPAAAQEQLAAFLAAGTAKGTLQLVFDEPSLSATLAGADANDFDAYGQAFGAAMPYLDTFTTRRNHVLRRIAYGPLWAAHFAAPAADLSLSNWQNRVKHAITEGGLRNFETSGMPNTFPNMLVTQYPHVRAERATFADGAKRLLGAITNANSPDVIPKAYSALEQLWSQRPFVTAAGVYLIDLARKAGVLGAVTRTLTVSRGEDTLVLTSQA
jgi:hypothetical protein